MASSGAVSAATPPVLIVGAGPTGLVLALWLSKFGIPVRIIDKTSSPGTTSRAFAVQARTLELYEQQPGLAEAAIELGQKVDALRLATGDHGIILAPLGSYVASETRYPYILVLPQDEHERLLIRHLEKYGVTVERETEFVSFTEDKAGVHVTLRGKEGETKATYRALCGCDGAHSTVRHGMNMGFDGGTYAQLFYVADVEAAGHAAGSRPFFCLQDKDICLVFPMRHEMATRLVGIVPATVQKPLEEISYADVSQHVSEVTGLTVSKVNWFSVYRVHHRRAASFQRGRVFLLGDAAHIHSPAGGQGMNTGIGDAINLAWKLKEVLQGAGTPTLLQSYGAEREAFAKRLLKTTDALFRIMTDRGVVGWFGRKIGMPFVMPLLLRHAASGRGIFHLLSQLGIRYRDSFLSEGGGVAGDRLPFVAAIDNYVPLREGVWQLHVYGSAAPAVASICKQRGWPLHVFPYSAEVRAAGLSENASYLLRPDGYIARVSAPGEAEGLKYYGSAWRRG